MATLSLEDPRFKPLTEEEKNKQSNKLDIENSLYNQKSKTPEAEENNEISG